MKSKYRKELIYLFIFNKKIRVLSNILKYIDEY